MRTLRVVLAAFLSAALTTACAATFRTVGQHDPVQLIAVLRAGLEEAQHHQGPGIRGLGVAHSPPGL